MEEFLKSILASDMLTEDAKAEIQTSLEALIESARNEAQSEVRTELAEQYQADINRLVSAMDKKINESLSVHLKDVLVEKKQAETMKLKASRAIAEAETRAKKRTKKVLEAFSKRIDDRLKAELTPLHEDRELERSAVVRKLKELEVRDVQRKERFVTNGSKVLESVIDDQLKTFMGRIRNDLEFAKKNDFGRKIFEAFSDEFELSFMNRDSHLAKISKQLATNERKSQFNEGKLKKANADLKKRLLAERKERMNLQETAKRTKIIEGLIKPLTGSTRNHMKSLLEGTSTPKLKSTFERYRGIVSEKSGASRRRKTLSESRNGLSKSKLHEGRKSTVNNKTTEDVDEDILALRRRLGNK